MPGYQRILVPVDFSDCSPALVRHAAELAEPHGATLHLLHVAELPRGLGREAQVPDAAGQLRPVAELLRQEAEERLLPLLGVAVERGVQATSRVVQGTAADQVLDEARRLPADLIVMGSHGRTGLRRLLLGSVSEQVLRHALVPVLTVRGQHHAGCEASSCQSCRSGSLEARLQADAELDG